MFFTLLGITVSHHCLNLCGFGQVFTHVNPTNYLHL